VLDGDTPDKLSIKPQLEFGDYATELYDPETRHTDDAGSIVRHDQAAANSLIRQIEAAAAPYPELWGGQENGAARLRHQATLTSIKAAEFYTQIVPGLERNPSVVVHHGPNIPKFQYDAADPVISFRVDESDEHDWFNLGVTVTVSGEAVEFTDLFTALSDEKTQMMLPSGRVIRLDHPSFNKLRDLITESRAVHENSSEGLTVSRYQAGLWEELEALGVTARQTAAWQSAMQSLLATTPPVQIPAPDDLQATLRPYQAAGFSWLAFLANNRLGGILADDMGLGKTMQVISLLLWHKGQPGSADRRPIIIVAPTSVVENWAGELARFAPTLTTVIMRSGDRTAHHAAAVEADVVVTSYALFIAISTNFRPSTGRCDSRWLNLSKITNRSRTAIRQFKADFKIASRTPLETTS
jgi:hypothetical protein